MDGFCLLLLTLTGYSGQQMELLDFKPVRPEEHGRELVMEPYRAKR